MIAVKEYNCPAEAAIGVIGGKWKPWIIWYLGRGALRFSELMRELPGISPTMLTRQLRELEGDRVVQRKIYPEIPPKVEYSLTPRGRSALSLVESLCQWGSEQLGTGDWRR